MSTEFTAGPADQRTTEERPDVLVYTSDPLLDDIEVTGRVRMRLHAATDAPSTDWVVRLCDVDTDGVSRNVCDGTLRVHGTPGEPQEHEIDLWSTSIAFLAGHRIRVQITSSNFGCVRLVYNRALDVRTTARGQEQRRVGSADTSALLTAWKRTEELAFLNTVRCEADGNPRSFRTGRMSRRSVSDR